jgi:hypothetical protein
VAYQDSGVVGILSRGERVPPIGKRRMHSSSPNISYGARMVDILASPMLRLLTKPVAPSLSKPGSSASVGQLRQNEAHPCLWAG